jgi:hypothetical protein
MGTYATAWASSGGLRRPWRGRRQRRPERGRDALAAASPTRLSPDRTLREVTVIEKGRFTFSQGQIGKEKLNFGTKLPKWHSSR